MPIKNAFAIKAEIRDPHAKRFVFAAQKTMYGGKKISRGDAIFIFASENEGGRGLVARGVVLSANAIPKKRGMARQTPRVSITVKRTELATKALGRSELRPYSDWRDGAPETELNFKFYRQATNKIGGISESGDIPRSLLWRCAAYSVRQKSWNRSRPFLITSMLVA